METDRQDTMLAALNEGQPPHARITRGRSASFGNARIDGFTLGNGLQVIVWEDPNTSVFSYQTWFRVGSSDETPGRTGMAHLFEHLMFKGTEEHPAGVLDNLLEAQGIQLNASTWLDWTFYREKAPANRPENLRLIARLEADRMVGLQFNSAQLESERAVVKNERLLRIDNDADGTLYEDLYSVVFPNHPYGWPTIGWMADIEAIPLEECLTFYARYYAPNNAVIVVVGAVDTADVLRTVQGAYGALAPTALEPAAAVEELPAHGPITRELTLEVATYRLVLAWHAPAGGGPDSIALQVFDEILNGGDSSLLQQHLVHDQELALWISSWVSECRHPGVYEISAAVRPGEDPAKLEEALLDLLERLLKEGVSERELEKAKNGIEASFLRDLADTDSRARGLGDAEIVGGDFSRFLRTLDDLARVDCEEVNAIARAVLRPEHLHVVRVTPKEAE